MRNIVLVFCLYPMYSIYVDRVLYLNKVLILLLSTILFMMCLVFMSLTNYVQLILYTNILMVILKLVFGTLFTGWAKKVSTLSISLLNIDQFSHFFTSGLLRNLLLSGTYCTYYVTTLPRKI